MKEDEKKEQNEAQSAQELVIEKKELEIRKPRTKDELVLEDLGMYKIEHEMDLAPGESVRVRPYVDDDDKKRLIAVSTREDLLDGVRDTVSGDFVYEPKLVKEPEPTRKDDVVSSFMGDVVKDLEAARAALVEASKTKEEPIEKEVSSDEMDTDTTENPKDIQSQD